ncbi:hypothetical protein ACM0AZ_12545 [Mycobacteroides abscessus subsp. massiliense]|nr:hypothetical protein [Mycobacteroides abscessus]SLI53545.1 Uncharacterised protein [Mycobacteroides abscessus subsp. massiliense]
MEAENPGTTACSECETQNEVLVRLVDALMALNVDFEIHQHAA